MKDLMPFSKTKVIFNSENVKLCLCAKCTVQENSACARQKIEKFKALEENGDLPKKDDIPKLYCGAGPSTCKDIDTDLECLCSNCPVWYKYFLAKEKPTSHFCRYGRIR
jgi:hypothetical protein